MPEKPLFSLTNVTLGHNLTSGQQQTVLSIDNLTIQQGEKVALLGISGSGKSTLLDHLYRQNPGNIAYCPQRLGLVPILSVFHNIYIGELQRHSWWYNLLNLLWPQSLPRQRIEPLASQLGLQEKLFNSVEQLSGGQQQRTALARALNREEQIFFGDEPVSAIDPVQARDLIELINAGHETVVVALHDKDLALSCFDRVIGIHNGRIILDATTDSVSDDQLTKLYQR